MSLRQIAERVPLRTLLPAVMAVLLAIGLLLSAGLTTSALRNYLLDQTDEQLRQVAERTIRMDEVLGDGLEEELERRGQGPRRPPSSYFIALANASSPTSWGGIEVLATDDEAPRIPPPDALRPGVPITVPPAEDGSDWRMLARPTRSPDVALIVATDLDPVSDTVMRLLLLQGVIGGVVILSLVAASWWFVRRALQPLRDVEATAAGITAGNLAERAPVVSPHTEAGHVASALNTMLDRLEGSFSQVRQFVADASHELRTPLTSISGYAQLYRSGALTNQADVDKAMSRIEDESARMTELVEDLLLLARLDQRRPMRTERVDLLEVARDAVRDADVSFHDHEFSLDASGLVEQPVMVGDRNRLQQVIGNLLTNAGVHTPGGTHVVVAVVTAQGRAIVRVSDDGPGMDVEAADRVFERFFRVDDARNRQSGGSGLGLSIVRSVVEASGGEVSLQTAPGEGATFVLTFPLAPVSS